MARKLGSLQVEMLRCLRQHGYFYAGCGWIWQNYSITTRVLDSLVKRGLVIRTEQPTTNPGPRGTYTHVEYRPVPQEPHRVVRHTTPVVPEGKRPIRQIAAEICKEWTNVYFGAVPYLEAMSQLDTLDDVYGVDSAETVIQYFLSNAGNWRGEAAKRIKAELREMTK